MQMSEQILFYLAQDVIRKDMVNRQPNSVVRDFEIENGVLKKYIGNDSAVVIPNGVTKIAEYAFDGCDSLKSIEIPVGVKSVDSSAFYYCSSLESITVARGNAIFHGDGNCLIETASKTLVLGCKNSIIPADESVKSIGDRAFWMCALLENIEIPENCALGYDCFPEHSKVIKA